MGKNNSIYYEFHKDGKYVKTGFKTLNELTINTGIDTVPTMALTIPLSELPTVKNNDADDPLTVFETNYARYEIHVYFIYDGKVKYKFMGVVDKAEISYADYNITFNLSHRVARMREWLMPVNYAVKNTDFDYAIGEHGCQLGSSSTIIDSQSYKMEVEIEVDVPEDTMPKLEMRFSSSNKLAALTEACENTIDLHWRVDLGDKEGDHIVISRFGEEKDCTIQNVNFIEDECAKDETDSHYVTMLTEPTYTMDYTDHVNRAIVFCGDVGAGVFHLTLKGIYDHPEYVEKGFPVGLYNQEVNLQPETEFETESMSDEQKCAISKINNERVYKDNEALSFANNDNREYYVTDEEQLEEDGGIIKQVVYNFADLYPIPKLSGKDDKCEEIEYMITDADRLEITKRAYYKAIRNLKAQRPEHIYQFNCGALPVFVADGDKVLLSYAKEMSYQFPEDDEAECANTDTAFRKVVNVQKKMYVTKRTIIFDDVMNEYTTLTLDEVLRPRSINAVEIDLHEKLKEAVKEGDINVQEYHGETSTDVTRGTNSELRGGN